MSDQELTRNDENTESIDAGNEIPFVGLKNQGATCYMNSLLQALFHLPAFRRIVYKMPTTGNKDESTNIPLNLQRLFAMMQFSDLPCSTKLLTKSFGWGDYETFMQHDLQEFSRVLIDNLETKLKGDPELKDSISNILKGQYVSFIRCKNVLYESSRNEDFYDLTLQVKGCSNLQESFQKYIQKEQLVGDNQYKTDEFGLQDAEMGVEFTRFPSVLHLHLSRFEYDPETDQMTKINDKFEFPESIDLAPFLSPKADHSQSLMYDLYGVLVHMGNVSSGHYYAFLRTSTDPQWYKFDDNFVSKVESKDAIEDNFGETQSNSRNDSYHKTNNYGYGYGLNNYGYNNYYNNYYNNFGKRYSAYMLVYIQRSDANRIMAPVTLSDIPKHLQQYAQTQIQMKKRNSEIKNDKKNNHFLVVLRDEDLKNNSLMGIDIYVPPFLNADSINIFNQHQLHPDSPIYLNGEEKDQNNYRYDLLSNLIFKIGVKKTTADIYKMVSKRFDVPNNEIRIWHQEGLQNRLRIVNNYDNQLIDRKSVPSDILFYQHKDVDDVVSMRNEERFIFVKYFFPTASLPIQFIRSYVVKTTLKFPDFCNQVNEELGIKLEEDDKMLIYRQYNDNNTGIPVKVDIIQDKCTMSDVPSGVFIYLQIDPTLDINDYYKPENTQTFDPLSSDYDEKLRTQYLDGDDHLKQLIDEKRKKMIEKRDRVYSILPSKFKLQDPIPVQSFIINEEKENEPLAPKEKVKILKESEIFPKTAMIYPFFILEKYNKIEIDIYSYDHQEKPIFTIETYKYSTVQRLKEIIAHGINVNYNPKHNAMILYIIKDKKFYYQANANDKENIQDGNDDDENEDNIVLTVYESFSHQTPTVADLLADLDTNSMNKNYRIYFNMMEDVDERQAMYLHQYSVQISFDGVNIQHELKILDNFNITLRELFDKVKVKVPQIAQIEAQCLSQKKESNDDEYEYDDDEQIEQIFRFYSMSNHLYSKKLNLANKIDYYSDNIRIDLIPEEQRDLKDDETLIQVTYMHMDRYEGNPFFVVFKKGEEFSEVKKRILQHVPDKNEVINFSIRQKYNSYYNNYYRYELKDDSIISDLYYPKTRLYINLKNKRNESSSIKIYN